MKIPSSKKIGIIGGGQFGKMLLEAASPWNMDIAIIENDEHAPAAKLTQKFTIGDIKSDDDVYQFGKDKDVITYEIEHISISGLDKLEAIGVEVIPKAEVLKIIHNKAIQKQFYTSNNIPTAPYCVATNAQEFEKFINTCVEEKVVVKAKTGGYDGKGVQILAKSEALKLISNFDEYLLEQCVPEIIEYSVIVAVGSGEIKSFPMVEMFFNPKTNLVEFLYSPTHASEVVEQKCREIAENAAAKLNSKGLFAVELIVTGDQIYVNEIAPRPHNSGHHTIEGAITSQFEQLNRILLGMPLGETDMIKPTAMINLVGAEGQNGNYALKYTEELMKMSEVYVHLYNKSTIKPHRKMGHINLMANTLPELMEKAKKVKELCEFELINS